MMINHTVRLDMLDPGTPTRIQVKQGDTRSRAMTLELYAGSEPWPVPSGAQPVIRWFASDPDSGKSARGIYDKLPDGTHAWTCAQNQVDILLAPMMFNLPGLVQVDVVLTAGEETISTFNFEFYVNPAPVTGTEPEAQNWYKVVTLDQINGALDQINGALDSLEEWRAQADFIIAHLEQRVYELERMIHTQ